MNNPFQQYFRQPKIYISLPSKGLFYDPGILQGDYNSVPIFAMSGVDEIMLKTPDALFNGESTVKVIESCCPFIKNANKIPSLDIDAILMAIKIATYGDKLTLTNNCKNCNTENDYELSLGAMLDHFSSLKFNSTVKVSDEISISVRPLKYEEITYFSTEHFKLQKILGQLTSLPEDEKNKAVEDIYQKIAELQLELYIRTIESVRLPNTNVTNKNFIEEWLRNTDRDVYQVIKDSLENNRSEWSMPSHNAVCSNCGAEEKLSIILDSSNFFV